MLRLVLICFDPDGNPSNTSPLNPHHESGQEMCQPMSTQHEQQGVQWIFRFSCAEGALFPDKVLLFSAPIATALPCETYVTSTHGSSSSGAQVNSNSTVFPGCMGCPHMFPHVSTIFNLLSASVFYLWLRPKSTPAAFAANGLVLASFSPLPPHQKPLCGMPSPSTCQAKTSVEKLGESGRIWENWVWYRSGLWSLCVCAGLHLWSHKSTGLRKSSWIMLDCDRKMNQSKSNNTWFGWKLCFFSHCVLMILWVGRPCFL